MKAVYMITDKETKETTLVSLNIFLACFGEVPGLGVKMENDYVIGSYHIAYVD